MAENDPWDQPERLAPDPLPTHERLAAEALIVDVDGFEGPLDLLLTLSRTQKVDLRKISVLKLAEQYLGFVEQARSLRIELAADYLVMAAWLAFLKSRLLLPPEPGDAGPSAEDLATHLAYQLERLQAMRDAAARLMGRDQRGRDFFARGLPEDLTHQRKVRWTATLLDLMRAYAMIRTKDEFRPFVLDLRKISVLKLAEQYLGFVEQARSLRIELAADYLVMAAWLAFLKSRLLLPPEPGDAGPSAEDLATHLAYQLERLQAMRDAAARLMGRDQRGRDFFARGLPEDLTHQRKVRWTATLLDLMRAYAMIRTKDEFRPFVLDREHVYTMEQALDRMRGLIGFAGSWATLTSFLPDGWDGTPMARRSAMAAHFAAVLELAKAGQITLRQGEVFAPIELRRRDA